jgi:hypothetical protein
MGIMRALSPTYGDLTLTWDPTDQATVDTAIAEFETQLAAGKLAIRHDPGKLEDEQIRAFDPEAEEIVFISPLPGG